MTQRALFSASIGSVGLSDASLTLVRDLIAERAGVYYDEAKLGLLADRISEHVTAEGLTSLLDYYYLLRYDAEAPRHWQRLMDRLAVPETYFWRQWEQMETLATIVAPRLLEMRDGPITVWSAACCTGEEPLSIAIALLEQGIPLERVRIWASDASPAMVERARRGVYRERAFRQLPAHLREKYFQRVSDDEWRITDCVSRAVTWGIANLMNPEEWAAQGHADVIFCRNVFIYFSDRAIRHVATLMAGRMPAHGYLFLGASESLTRFALPLELAEIGRSFVYVKTPGT